MKEDLIEFETAKLAKKKGFEAILYSYYESNSKELIQNHVTIRRTFKSETGTPYGQNTKEDYEAILSDIDNSLDEFILAPTQSLLQKWLREKHNIIVLLEPVLGFSHIEFSMSIYTKKNIFSLTKFHVSSNKTYEEALEAGLIEGLKLIKGL
jgi:hypothetical protein